MSKWEKKEELEADFQSEVLELLHMRGWFAQKIEFKGRRGGPDVIAIKKSRTIWLEVKRLGEEARRQQEFVHREMRSNGAEVYSNIDTLDKVRAIIQ